MTRLAQPTDRPTETGSNARCAPTSGIERPLFVLLLLCYLWPIDLDPGANVWAHIDQAAAIIAYHTLSIDTFMNRPEGLNTVDWSRTPDGHIYPGKAPGCAFAAVPILGVLYYVESALGIRPFEGDWFRRNAIIVNWALNSLGSALAMTLLLRVVLSAGVAIVPSVFGVLSIALGTAYYPYATTYYAHNLAANLIIASAFVLFSAASFPTRDAMVGLLAGFAVAFDYAAVLAVLVFAGALVMTRPRALVPFVAGGLVPLALLAWYHTVVFGGPLETAYAFLNPKLMPPNGELLRPPRLSTLLTLTVSPYRGIFFYSPVLLLAFVGAWRALARSQATQTAPSQIGRRERAIINWAGLALFGLWFLFNASYHTWWGGWTAGSRYIVPGLALLAPAIGLGFATFPRSGAALLAISVANHLAISTALIQVDHDVMNPLREVVYPLFWNGDFQRSNLGRFFFGLNGPWSLTTLVLPATMIGFVLARRLAPRSGVRAASASGTHERAL